MTRVHITESLTACPWFASGRFQPVATGDSRPIGNLLPEGPLRILWPLEVLLAASQPQSIHSFH